MKNKLAPRGFTKLTSLAMAGLRRDVLMGGVEMLPHLIKRAF